MRWLGRLLGISDATAIDAIEPALAAPWAQSSAFWVVLACVLALVGSLVFYVKYQTKGTRAGRIALGVCRGLLLALLILTLADPVLRLTVTRELRPNVYVIFDGTDSMAIADDLPDAQRDELQKAVGKPTTSSVPTRTEWVQNWLTQQNALTRLQEEKKVQLEAFVFDGATTSQLRKIPLHATGDDKIDPKFIAEQLTTKGQVTALGNVIKDTGRQLGSGRLAGVVLVSDFAWNSGPAPDASKLGAPLYAVGVGAVETVDLAVDIQTDPRMKKAERSQVTVKLRQSGLKDRQANVVVTARRLSGDSMGGQETIRVGERVVTLDSPAVSTNFDFTPDEAGRFEFLAQVEKLDGEALDQNNHAAREVTIIDDYLRLMYVAHEPTWEWRFIKEVFHRDKLVGMQGFRTYLGSSDPRVRESNVLFLSTLTPKRSDFFVNDVLFLDDVPRAALTDRFGDMVKEYVGELGGGLVVITGPRFGPKELIGTPLEDMLPVRIDPQATVRDDHEFKPRLTPLAAQYPFMNLGQSEQETAMAWDNLGKLQWYQPVAAPHESAVVLAEHPSDKCADGKTPQPLISIRRYGKGDVVFLSFNETWRLRRKYGEKYYRQFWSQLIYRLGMSHALGNQKRFVVQLDQPQYRAEEKVRLTIEAFNENYEPLTEDTLPDRTLAGELTIPSNGVGAEETRLINIPMRKPGEFEVNIPVFAAGEYSLRVKDPITGKYEERRFEVTGLPAERLQAVRNVGLQQDLARESGGRSYDLTTVSRLVDDIHPEPVKETLTRNQPLWATPFWFALLVTLMLSEWLTRKLIKLS